MDILSKNLTTVKSALFFFAALVFVVLLSVQAVVAMLWLIR
jgi:hypothetical protein